MTSKAAEGNMSTMNELQDEAEAGLVVAQEELGQLFLSGDGAPQSISKAVFWLRRAAAQGSVGAQLQLGMLCADGWIEAQTDPHNAAWLRVASSCAYERAAAYLHTFYPDATTEGRSISELVRQWLELANQGDREAQRRLATIYRFGFGVDENRIEAERWYRSSAAGGTPHLVYALGEFLLALETPDKVEEGLRCYEAAALGGFTSASFALGMLYAVRDQDDPYTEDQMALSIVPNRTAETKWFRLAASQGHDEAKAHLFYMMRNGFVGPADDQEEAAWTLAAARLDQDAQAHMATLYEAGRGVERDTKKAEQMRLRAISRHRGPIRLGDNPAGGDAF